MVQERFKFFEVLGVFALCNLFNIILYILFLLTKILGGKSLSLFLFNQSFFVLVGSVWYIFKDVQNKNEFLKSILSRLKLFEFKIILKYVLYILLTTVFVSALVFVIGKLFNFEFSKSKNIKELKYGWDVFLYVVTYLSLGPLAEEIFFRVLLFGSLRNRFNLSYSIVITSLFFGILHISGFGHFIFAFISSCFLSYMYEKHKNIFMNVLTHSLINIPAILYIVISGV